MTPSKIYDLPFLDLRQCREGKTHKTSVQQQANISAAAIV